jgi:hypothetical protein
MDDDFNSFVTYVWQHRPILVVVLVSGVIIFALLVIDTHRHRKKQKDRHPKKH